MPATAPPQTGHELPVMEHFLTLQGEGHWTGTAAYFIRLGGCDVGCVWCDVKESWNADAHPRRPVDELAGAAQASGAPIAVITGGEPLMHPLGPLSTALKDAGLRVHIETSGAHSLSGDLDWVTFSPKKFKAPLPAAYKAADELKIVVYNRHDLQWAEEQATYVRGGCELFLQPEWSRPQTAQWIVEHVKAQPRWRLSLQTHKFLAIP